MAANFSRHNHTLPAIHFSPAGRRDAWLLFNALHAELAETQPRRFYLPRRPYETAAQPLVSLPEIRVEGLWFGDRAIALGFRGSQLTGEIVALPDYRRVPFETLDGPPQPAQHLPERFDGDAPRQRPGLCGDGLHVNPRITLLAVAFNRPQFFQSRFHSFNFSVLQSIETRINHNQS
jgi:hypothetical protein